MLRLLIEQDSCRAEPHEPAPPLLAFLSWTRKINFSLALDLLEYLLETSIDWSVGLPTSSSLERL
jgi:hypothetical protein